MNSAEEHRQAMQELQARQKAKVRSAEHSERGLVLVHTGYGKGKSSSPFGVIARALGWGHQVGVVQFIKGIWKTGGREFFKRFPDAVHWHTMGEGFTWNTQDRVPDISAAEAALTVATSMMQSGTYDLVLLDEINIALRYDYLDVLHVHDAIQSRDTRTSVILTGRNAKQELMDMADLGR